MKSAPNNWTSIKAFLLVVRTGSTLAASRELGVTQPTVARRIDELEHELGLVLFDRDTRGFHLAPQAKRLVAEAEQVEAAVQSFGASATELSDSETLPIRFSAPISVFSDAIYEILAQFRATYPDTPIEVIPSNKFLDLNAGDGDIALRITSEIKDEELICRKLGALSGGLFASRVYPGPLPSHPYQLKRHKFAIFDGQNVPHALNNWLLGLIEPDQVVTKCSDLGSMVATISKGEVLGPLPRPLGENNEKLAACLYAPDNLSVPVWIVISPAAYRRKNVRAFVKLMAKRYQSFGW